MSFFLNPAHVVLFGIMTVVAFSLLRRGRLFGYLCGVCAVAAAATALAIYGQVQAIELAGGVAGAVTPWWSTLMGYVGALAQVGSLVVCVLILRARRFLAQAENFPPGPR